MTPFKFVSTKRWFASKTIWAAFLTGALAAVNYYTGAITDPGILSGILAVAAVLQVLLRLVTEGPIQPK
jgi:uncharacterized protein YraI